MKKSDLLWSCSLIVIGICSIILAGANILNFDLPDFITRIIGLIDLAALPVLGYTSIKMLKNSHQ